MTELGLILRACADEEGGIVHLARAIGVERTTLWHVMRGRPMKLETLTRIAAYLKALPLEGDGGILDLASRHVASSQQPALTR